MPYTKLNLHETVTRGTVCVRYELLTPPRNPEASCRLEMRWFTMVDRDGNRSLRTRWIKAPGS